MFKVGRICIPLGLECNLKCRYCFRQLPHGSLPLALNELMMNYLQNISSEWCRAVVLSGGEPLLYWHKIKTIFELLQPGVGKCILTNGTLLTQEKVDYINKHRIEVAISHDGEQTKYLRGVDVLNNPKLLDLIRQINSLTLSPVITSKNCNVISVYKYISEKLGRDNFYFLHGVVMDNGHNKDLIDGFDYDTYARTYREFVDKYHKITLSRYLSGDSEHCSFNVDLHGNVVNKITLHKYGTVLDSYEYCCQKKEEYYKDNYCTKSNCPLIGNCNYLKEYADAHNCRCSQIRSGYL